MYYLKPNETGECIIYGYEPEHPYLAAEELPKQLNSRIGYTQAIFTDLETAWREYIKIPTESDILQGRVEELEQLLADLASLQLEV